MGFECPECGAVMHMDETFEGMMHISCSRCGLEDTLEPGPNPDEIFLEFLVRHDSNAGGDKKTGDNNGAKKSQDAMPGPRQPLLWPQKGIQSHLQDVIMTRDDTHNGINDGNINGSAHDNATRPENEIAKMIGSETPDPLVREILYTKKAYLADHRIIREPESEYGQVPTGPRGLDQRLAFMLKRIGISRLYKFQEDAIRHILAEDNVVIEAPTASGKTEAFLIPVVQRVLGIQASGQKDRLHAIFTYPTKALARDQMPKIRRVAEAVGLAVALVDGDTDAAERAKIAARPPHMLVTNFDLLHHQMWRRTRIGRLLRTVRIMVVDEVHSYTGIFGSNVHHIIRRLARVAGVTENPLKNRMQFIGASATIRDAARFCSELFGVRDMVRISGTGPSRQVEFAMLFPSRQSPRSLMADLTRQFASAGHRTMAFSNSHRGAELVAMHCQRKGVRIRVHRAGLVPEQRIAIETAFKSKKLQAVSCTSTLELGIDIGNTDCVVSAPTPVNRLTQRIGRAARRQGSRGYAFLALGDDPISQYYKNHPDDYFEDAESLYIDAHNPYVEECQVIAMAYDKHIKYDELPQYESVIERLVSRGDLWMSGGFVRPFKEAGGRSAARILEEYNIRGMGESVDITYNGTKVGDRVCPVALDELHKGAVYLLAGRPYMVKEFDYPDRQYAVLGQLEYDYPYHTRALTSEQPHIEEITESRRVLGIEAAFCRLRIQKIVTGYVRINWQDAGPGKTAENSENITMLERPLQYTYITKGIVFCAPRPRNQIEKVAADGKRAQYKGLQQNQQYQKQAGFSTMLPSTPPTDRYDESYVMTSGYHAAEHVVIEGSNMITGGASRDLGGISMGDSGMIFIHDGVIGGSGASRALYERLEAAFERGAMIVSECRCASESGCPRCIMSYRCGNNNQYLHKAAALEIFERINSGEQTDLLDSFEEYVPIV